MEDIKTIEEKLEEIMGKISELVKAGKFREAQKVYEHEYKAAEEVSESLWECQ